jgi:hypothetical protein
VPAGDGETVRGDAPRVVAIAQRERVLEHRARRARNGRADDRSAATDSVGAGARDRSDGPRE